MNRSLKLFLALVSLCMTTFCFAQKSELQFNKDGKFKIVQFTDVHFKYKNPASDIALERINQVLDEEQPDFVIFTGDVVYSAPADKGMLQEVPASSTNWTVPSVPLGGACLSSRIFERTVALGMGPAQPAEDLLQNRSDGQ